MTAERSIPGVAHTARSPLDLHPQARELMHRLGETTPSERTVESARDRSALLAQMVTLTAEVAEVVDTCFSGPSGAVAVRRYVPLGETAGTLVYLHGGGWVTGDLELADGLCRVLADRSGCEVLSVDYALAPEHPFPLALEDALGAVAWAAEMRSGPLVLGGDSAGANLAAVAARRLRDVGEISVCMQLLAYPITDAAMATAAYAEHAAGSGPLTAASMRWYVEQYLRGEADWEDPDISPLRAPSLQGLPPAHVVVAEHDPLRDDGLLYAAALQAAGVRAEVDYHGDMFHGFCMFVGVLDSAERALTTAGLAIRAAVARELDDGCQPMDAGPG